MAYISIGYVSGAIAAAVFLLQFILPNAVILILVGFLSNEESAVTWSVVDHSLAQSDWPNILRADTTSSDGLSPRILWTTWLRSIALALIAIAGIATPLGLYETIAISDSPKYLAFEYLADTGPMGYGTPPRSGQGFSRVCGSWYPVQCPGTTVEIIYSFDNATGDVNVTVPGDDYDERIPKVLASLYQSGLSTQPQSVSSFFDIDSRSYTFAKQPHFTQGEPYIVDTYRQLDTFILDDDIEAHEGVIVDTINGGVGFRNHTVPSGVQFGAEWKEDILFLQPETACVDTNVTWEYYLPWQTELWNSGDSNRTLVDQGGFVNLNHTYPEFDRYNDQANPHLQERAYKAAWLVNTFNMLYFNVTRPNPNAFAYLNSSIGKRFDLGSIFSASPYITLQTTDLWNTLANIGGVSFDGNGSHPIWPNPYDITWSNYSIIDVLCMGAGGADLANMSNIAVQCGLVFGTAQRRDGVETLIFEPGTWWTQRVYSCASATRAVIKTVHFKYNATIEKGMKQLQILDLADKTYQSEAEKPLWGVENPNMTLAEMMPLWGLISDEAAATAVNLSTIRSDHLYLPGTTIFGDVDTLPGYENIPAVSWPINALAGAYGAIGAGNPTADYTGSSSLAILSRWKTYSRNVTTAGKILNLIYTDILANALVGTKGWGSGSALPPDLIKRDSSNPSSSSASAGIPVAIYTHQIRYHWFFAIPAFVVLAFAVLLLSAALASSLRGRSSPSRIRYFLFHLSAGRLLTRLVNLHGSTPTDPLEPTRTWLETVGQQKICLDDDDASPSTELTDEEKRKYHDSISHGEKGKVELTDRKTSSLAFSNVILDDENDDEQERDPFSQNPHRNHSSSSIDQQQQFQSKKSLNGNRYARVENKSPRMLTTPTHDISKRSRSYSPSSSLVEDEYDHGIQVADRTPDRDRGRDRDRDHDSDQGGNGLYGRAL